MNVCRKKIKKLGMLVSGCLKNGMYSALGENMTLIDSSFAGV